MAANNKKPDPKKLTAEEYVRELGRYGGNLRRENLTPARRKEIAKRAAEARWAKTDATPPTTPTPIMRGRKVSASDKRGRMGILLNRRPQLRLPLSIAAAILIVFALAFVTPAPLEAYNARFVAGVQGASPAEVNQMPAQAILQRVAHRKPVPYMPHASEPQYLLCYVVETLECGHQVTVYPQADPLIASRRRCQECDGGPLVAIIDDAPKKPSVSVRFPNLERKRA